MLLPESPDLGLLLVRTDYSDDAAWLAAFRAATALYEADDFERGGASLVPVEAPDLAGVTPHDLALLPRSGYLAELAVADARTMQDLTVLFVDLNEFNDQVGRTFRAIPEEVEPIVANLAISNMDFSDFANSTDPDGVFRGFERP